MEPVVITISHSIGKDAVIGRLKAGFGRTAQSFPIIKVEHEQWTGDRMDFRVRALGQGIAGMITVGERDVRMELNLPWLLAKFAGVVQKTIAKRGRILIDKK